MKKIFKSNPTNFSPFGVTKFIPHIYNSCWESAGFGCGENCLSLLTGEKPNLIVNSNKKNPNDWKDSFLIKFLKDRGFKVLPVTINDKIHSITYITHPLHKDNVLLVSQWYSKSNASWCVIWRDWIFHNHSISRFGNLEFLNTPILSCYVLWHKKWA